MLPNCFQPMLASIADPFDSHDFTYEIKWDGYRCLAFLDSNTRLLSRNQKDITFIFPELKFLHQRMNFPGCLIDGEVIALRNGEPSFLELQKRAQLRDVQKIKAMIQKIPVVYIAFDLLYFDSTAIIKDPIEKRRELLANSFDCKEEFIIANFIEERGKAYFESISELGLEGVIAKKRGSPYLPGKRSKTWLKFKRKLTQNFTICGYVLHSTTRGELSSLILGAYSGGILKFFGMVGSGFTQTELKLIEAELEKLKTTICPFTATELRQKNTVWVQPFIVCEIEYSELTDDGSLRHPVFKRFLPNLKPIDCQFEA